MNRQKHQRAGRRVHVYHAINDLLLLVGAPRITHNAKRRNALEPRCELAMFEHTVRFWRSNGLLGDNWRAIADGLALLGTLANHPTFSWADVSSAADVVRRTRSSVLVVAKLRRV